jgi:hypothetical protein
MAQRKVDAFCKDAVIRLLAHNEKEVTHGQTHFYEEFTDTLQSKGHVVKGVRVEELSEEEALAIEAPPRGKYLLEQMIMAPDNTPALFAKIEARVLKNRDAEGKRVQLEKYKLAQLDGISHMNQDISGDFWGVPSSSDLDPLASRRSRIRV